MLEVLEAAAMSGAQRTTMSRDQRALAAMIDRLGDIESDDDRECAFELLATSVAVLPRMQRALDDFRALAEVLGEEDELGEDDWYSGMAFDCAQLDDLMAMAEPSGFADPATLLDPSGKEGVTLAHMVPIASLRAASGDPRFTVRVTDWLRAGARREDEEKGATQRRDAFERFWPFRADGTLDGPNNTVISMIAGSFSASQRRLRSGLVRAGDLLLGPDPDAEQLERLLRGLGRDVTVMQSARVDALIDAACVRVALHRAQAVRASADQHGRDRAIALATLRLGHAEKGFQRGVVAQQDLAGCARLRQELEAAAGKPCSG